MKPLVTMQNITKSYHVGENDLPVLRGINLTIHKGEQLVIVGRSGSGKSTLMNILGLLDQPTAGAYYLAEQHVPSLDDDSLSALRGETIGFVFQSFHLLPGMTIWENVALPLTYRKIASEERRERASSLLKRVGLGHRLSHLPQQLSGGERQRVAIARALINRPSLLLADEPTGNLDSKSQQNILALFYELQQETGLTMVMVTHDQSIATHAQRLINISDGIIKEGHVE